MECLYHLIDFIPADWVQFSFMKNAFICILLISPLFALIGCLVVNNQMAFFSEAIGHSALTGIAIGTLLGLSDPSWSMIGFSTVIALSLSIFRRYSLVSIDTLLGLVMSFSVALGIVILSKNGSFAKFTIYLIGDILTITTSDIVQVFYLFVAVTILYLIFFNQLTLISVHRALARSRHIPVWLIETFFSIIIAIVVTIAIKWIGLLVINSLLILPAATSRNISTNSRQYHFWAILFSLTSGLLGLISSYYWNTATGATIVLFAMAFFLLSVGLKLTRTHLYQ